MYFSKSIAVFFFSAASALVLKARQQDSYGLEIIDTGTATTCGENDCCIPSCTVDLFGFSDCPTGQGKIDDNCLYNYDYPKQQEVPVDGCDGWNMYWNPEYNGVGLISINPPNGSVYYFDVTDCNQPTEGGNQCVPEDGGCTATFGRYQA